MSKRFHVHLVSDATGETLNAIVKAALAQFDGSDVEEHSYALVRNARQLARAIDHIHGEPGLVFFTLVNEELRQTLIGACRDANIPCLDVMEGPIGMVRQFLGKSESHRPGAQHDVDQRYLARIEALNFAIQHDDGQALDTAGAAEIVLVGASRTSKTPTCVYLAIRGVRAANVPLVKGIPLPHQLLRLNGAPRQNSPLIVGLWASPDRLVQVRRNRLSTMGEVRDTDYVDLEAVRAEVTANRRLFEQHDWPAIDVSRRSVEETAAAVINLLAERREALA